MDIRIINGKQKPVFQNLSGKLILSDGTSYDVKTSGVFSDKPDANKIYIGFAYFCTDKQTTEGSTNGIMIYHKGNNVWVDALGRVIS